jgi:hypothetical protein
MEQRIEGLLQDYFLKFAVKDALLGKNCLEDLVSGGLMLITLEHLYQRC